MNDVQVGRYSQLLHKLLSMAEGSPAPTLAPELFAQIALEVDRPEWEWLKGAKLCHGYHSDGAGAGARSMIAIRNPTGSNVLAVVHCIEAGFAGDYIILTQNLGNGTDMSGFSAGGAVRVSDFRAGVNDLGYSLLPTCELMDSTAALKGGAFYRTMTIAKGTSISSFRIETPMILPPNSAIIVAGSADNLSMQAAFSWTERTVDRMELQAVNPRLR